ncbi:MAG: protein translocase subunit SecD [Actinomycetota bacterium]|nr:protein translocase subunit SecD [Actinomycetota bacterium]
MARSRSKAPIYRAFVAFGVIAFSLYLALTSTARLGLDLEGGVQVVLETQDGDGVEANAENTQNALEVLRNRVDSLGVAESTLARSGDNRIIVELPGLENPDEAVALVGETAQLSFHPVLGTVGGQQGGLPPGVELPPGPGDGPPRDGPPRDGPPRDGPPQGEQELQPARPQPLDGGQPTDGPDDRPTREPTDEPTDGAGQPPAGGEEPALVLPDEQGVELELGPAALTGDAVTGAEAALTQQGVSEWVVNVDFDGAGGGRWADLTSDAACARDNGQSPRDRIAIVLDDEVISSPAVNDAPCGAGIQGGSTQITGGFTQETATDLAVLIEGGALPLPVEVISQSTVGPTLGDDAIDASVNAALIGLALTGLYICVVYRLMGLLATLALAAYTLLSYALLVFLGATLTLPGLAGFVLAIGLAIDANVLVFERAREEFARRRGEGLEPVLETGYQKALSAIMDSNITTLLAAGLLFFLAAGPVRGFGVTLSIGVLASMFSALVIARVFTGWAVRRSVVQNHPKVTGLAGSGRLRNWLEVSGPDLMKRSSLWVAIAVAVVALSVLGVVLRGLNLGVEFTGGRVMEFGTAAPVEVNDARQAVADEGYPTAVVQTVTTEGEEKITVRTEDISNAEATSIEASLAELAGGVTRDRDDLIGPSLGAELRNNAIIALGVALAAQMIYLAFRFRWTFGLAAIVAMVHDVVAVIGIFAWTGKTVDGIFLAAALTIIGLSVNDTVVVYDRVRERLRLRDREEFGSMVNSAALQTVPRTINTGLGAMIILAALVFLGGDSLTNFAIALLAGLVVGTLSSVFLASPLVVLFERRWPDPEAFGGSRDDDAQDAASARTTRRGVPARAGADQDSRFGGSITVATPKKRPRDKWARADPYADIPASGRDEGDDPADTR